MPPAQTLRGRHTFYPEGVLFRFQPNKAPLFKGENQRGDSRGELKRGDKMSGFRFVISTERAKVNARRNLTAAKLD